MILLIDNYDSFVYNLARYCERLGQETRVVRNDAIDVAGVERLAPRAIVISPGPRAPDDAGSSIDVIRALAGRTPILGVCLGHQAIAAAFGGRIVRARRPMHGRSSLITHDGAGIFAGLPNPLVGGRYHSLVVEESSLPEELLVTARADDGEVMALAHRRWPVVGVQFHPEAILTEQGFGLLAGFLRVAGLPTPAYPERSSELVEPAGTRAPLPTAPVTF